MEYSQIYRVGEIDIKISTGKLANLADGAVLLEIGGTTILATTTAEKKDTELDFFPLSVEYIERMYARGAISGSRFQKREGLPTNDAILKARQVDHSIRSLFPKSFKKPTSVILTVLSYDQENDPEILAVLGASLSIIMAKMPFYGPCSGVIACIDENNSIVINPKVEGREKYLAEFLITGVDDKALSIEGWGKEVSEDKMGELLDQSMIVIKQLNQIQRDFIQTSGNQNQIESTIEDFSDLPAPVELINITKEEKYEEIKKALFVEKDKDTNRGENLKLIKKDIETFLSTSVKDTTVSTVKYSSMQIDQAVEYMARKIVREAILTEGKRVTNRSLNQIRDMNAEIDVIKTVHGSAVFNRGLTQSLSIVTLGPKSSEQMIDDMEGETTKSFMHHYNMPPFSTGEAGRYNYHPGRREIGHGAIGENALRNMVPSQEVFPYTIRVVSEILSSNGSTSMAATCASSMALMASGVPLKSAVAGIGVGLITAQENEEEYKLLLDIEGIEDFYGDMDFKVTGTSNGITAIQYENKLRGVKLSILKEAFVVAKDGRAQVLNVMNNIISVHKQELSPNAPIVEFINIKQENIGALIGPGGKNIKDIIQQAEPYGKSAVDITIEDDGRTIITASNKAQLDFVKNIIKSMFEEPEMGKVYTGEVDKVTEYGVFVNVSSSISGLCHISEMFDKRTNADLSKIFQQGDEVKVMISKVENGRINFSMKGLEQTIELQEKLSEAEKNSLPNTNSTNQPRRTQERRF